MKEKGQRPQLYCLCTVKCQYRILLLTGNLEPNANCVRLDEFTEVIVSPKTRSDSFPKSALPSTKNSTQESNRSLSISDTEPQHTTTGAPSVSTVDSNNQLSASASSITNSQKQTQAFHGGLISRFSGYLQTLFYAHDDETLTSENETCKSSTHRNSTSNGESLRSSVTSSQSSPKVDGNILIKESDLGMCLRVQPELTMESNLSSKTFISKSTLRNCFSLQPLAVFVDFASLPPSVLKSWTSNLQSFPPPDGTIVKTVQISKLLSPKERAALLTSSRGDVASRTQEPTPSSDTETTVRGREGKYT